MTKRSQTNEKTSGPEPERVKIEGDWKDVVKKAMDTPPPENGDDTETEEHKNDGRTDE